MSRQGKKRKKTFSNVKDFWDSEALEWGDDPRVTIRDHYFRLLVKDFIIQYIKGKKNVIDIGCGTGFSSLYYSEVTKKITGIDYSEKMIEYANKFINNKKYFKRIFDQYPFGNIPKIKNNIKFSVGDILKINFPDNYFDAVITERVLVNLPSKKLQNQAVNEVFRVLGKKGIWVIAEASVQGNKNMNLIRKKMKLAKLERYWHNQYLDEIVFKKQITTAGFKIKKISHLETYQFLTRVFHPLLVYPNEPKFISNFNYTAYLISQNYPTYEKVKNFGFDSFILKFRKMLLKFEDISISDFDKIVKQNRLTKVNFKGAGNHIFYVLEKK